MYVQHAGLEADERLPETEEGLMELLRRGDVALGEFVHDVFELVDTPYPGFFTLECKDPVYRDVIISTMVERNRSTNNFAVCATPQVACKNSLHRAT